VAGLLIGVSTKPASKADTPYSLRMVRQAHQIRSHPRETSDVSNSRLCAPRGRVTERAFLLNEVERDAIVGASRSKRRLSFGRGQNQTRFPSRSNIAGNSSVSGRCRPGRRKTPPTAQQAIGHAHIVAVEHVITLARGYVETLLIAWILPVVWLTDCVGEPWPVLLVSPGSRRLLPPSDDDVLEVRVPLPATRGESSPQGIQLVV